MGIDFKKYYKETGQGCDASGFGWLASLITQAIITDKIFDGCKKILDVGCGTGCWTNYLRDRGFEVVGCDIDNSQFKETVVTDMHQLCFKDGEFDGIFCTGVFEHSIAPFIAMCEMSRVLKKDGVFYIDLPTEDNERVINLSQHVNVPTYFNMINLAKKVNLKLLKHQIINTPSAGLHQMYVFKKIK